MEQTEMDVDVTPTADAIEALDMEQDRNVGLDSVCYESVLERDVGRNVFGQHHAFASNFTFSLPVNMYNCTMPRGLSQLPSYLEALSLLYSGLLKDWHILSLR